MAESIYIAPQKGLVQRCMACLIAVLVLLLSGNSAARVDLIRFLTWCIYSRSLCKIHDQGS